MIASFPRLEKGSIVDIIAPASSCARSELRQAIQFVRALGLRPRVSPKIFGRVPIFAQTDDERFRQLKNALTASDSKLVWCIRGGYGSLRLLPRLAKLKRPKTFKLVLGYSDITSLHLFLNSVWRWPSVHGPMVGRFGRGDHTAIELKEVKQILFDPGPTFTHSLQPLNAAARRKHTLRASVVGGNMATLQSSLGTPWSLASKGRIVMLEDLSEKPHRIDRMLMQMEQAGVFRNARAVIFGDIDYPSTAERRIIWKDVIPRFAKSQKIPVLKGLKSGHGKVNRPLPFLTDATLRLGQRSELTVTLRPV
jgi:muramoyltetrapeptide carboxypeptidase